MNDATAFPPPPAVRLHRGALTDALVGKVRILATSADTHDQVAALSEQPLLNLTHGSTGVTHVLLDSEGSDQLLGYAQIDSLTTAELVVHPHHRRKGCGSVLLTTIADLTDRTAQVWAHGDLPAARTLAARNQMTVARELWQMRLSPLPHLHPADLPALPEGVHVRTFVPGQDEDAWLRLNAAAFDWHPEQGRVTRADLDARMAEPWFDPTGLLLAEQTPSRPGDVPELLAAGWTKIEPETTTGEIYVLGVSPSAQGQGLGRAMTARMLVQLNDRGATEVVLYTEGDNTTAIHTYRTAGFKRSALDVAYRW